jgi:hypothetical protein
MARGSDPPADVVEKPGGNFPENGKTCDFPHFALAGGGFLGY